MSLVGRVGRRKPRAVLATTIVYLLLCAGAVTTLYPFLLMVSTGFKGPTDENDDRLLPAFWFSDSELTNKYIHDKYKQDEFEIAQTRTGPSAPEGLIEKYRQFLLDLPPDDWKAGFGLSPNQMSARLEPLYQAWLRSKFHNNVDLFNRTYIEEATTFDSVSTPAELLERKTWNPPPGQRWNDWTAFKETLPAEFRIPVREQEIYQSYVRNKYQNLFAGVPASVKGRATSFATLAMPSSGPLFKQFLATTLPDRYRKESVEDRWAAVAGPGVPMPIEAFERWTLARKEAPIKTEMSWRNYRYVFNFIALHGRALWNTFFFAFLTIAAQLIINPLAAYALSRYPIKASAKILLFLLATMAFPAEVAMIPSFLLLKGLGLLNTFAALVLPGAASGYMIFLLKGFFDSLPQELFEAGQLDGAKETTLMMRVAVPLSKPVLGYLALLAFMSAYGSFLYAFLIAQDQKMWTLMVYIYQLQATSAPRSVIMAALTLAALPTLIVFLLCQRVIMRGIVLPGER
ncbi:MAG TPA: carbohydrate ABC transporter permease [Fimbriimonadaceae bacterium]|nr:carbohydrate ABC transporter permease [Fimbriimonadaceae bacterium]